MYNMKKKLILFYATEKEARYYLRHLNYGFILTENRQGQQILVENVPQLPRVALDNIGIFKQVEMPAEKQEKKFSAANMSDAPNDNLYLVNNPPAMPIQMYRSQPAKTRRINFSTAISSDTCNLRNHPYAGRIKQQPTKIPTSDVIRLGACDTSSSSSSNYSLPLVELPQFTQQLPPLPPVTFQKLPSAPPSFSQLPSTSGMVIDTQRQLYNNMPLSIPELSDSRCELPSTSDVAGMIVDSNDTVGDSSFQTPVQGARLSSQFEGLITEKLDPMELANIVEKKITINIKSHLQLTNTPGLEARNLIRFYNDPELTYNKTGRMLAIDNILQKLHTLDASVMSDNNSATSRYVSDWRKDEHTLELSDLDYKTEIVTVNINDTDKALLKTRTGTMVEKTYIISSMNNSKIIMPSFMIHRENPTVKYFLPPSQGFEYRNIIVFPVYNKDPEQRNKYIFYIVPRTQFYTNTINMNFVVNSNYTMTPTTNINFTDIKYLHPTKVISIDQIYGSFRRDIEYVKVVVNMFYELLNENINTDFNTLTPLFFSQILNNLNLTEEKKNTIFDGVGFDVFLHLFEILKSDVHRQFGIGSIFYALLPLPVTFNQTLVNNPEFFGFRVTTDEEGFAYNTTVETLASIYTTALFEYFENQPAPISFCNFYSPFIVPKAEIKLENINQYVEFQKKFPRGKLFDTLAMARTNLVHCDQMNSYYWEIVGNYAYVCNIVDHLLYLLDVPALATQAESRHPFKRPFPFNYILGRPVINVYMSRVPHIVKIHKVLTTFIEINKNMSLVDQIANGENWTESQRKEYNGRKINLKVVQSNVFVRVNETPFNEQYT